MKTIHYRKFRPWKTYKTFIYVPVSRNWYKIHIQGVPRNITIARRLESRLWYLNLFVTFSLLSTLTCMILETIITQVSKPRHFQKVVCVFCAFNITGDIKSLVQISILLNKSKIVEIWTKFFISRAVLSFRNLHCHTLSVILSLSYLPCHTLLFVPSLSYLTFCTFPVIPSLSYLPCHTCPVIPSLSYFICKTFSIIPSQSYLFCQT